MSFLVPGRLVWYAGTGTERKELGFSRVEREEVLESRPDQSHQSYESGTKAFIAE
jgi:hypothetical protein